LPPELEKELSELLRGASELRDMVAVNNEDDESDDCTVSLGVDIGVVSDRTASSSVLDRAKDFRLECTGESLDESPSEEVIADFEDLLEWLRLMNDGGLEELESFSGVSFLFSVLSLSSDALP